MTTNNNKKVLLIDDEVIIREVVQNCLEDETEWDVMTATSGCDGLSKVMAEKPDAIILDVTMPGMDGLAFLQILQANPATQSIPVILLTSRVEFIQPKQIYSLGLAGAIAKPFDPGKLVEQIATFLDWALDI